jgi:hypothetical protein
MSRTLAGIAATVTAMVLASCATQAGTGPGRTPVSSNKPTTTVSSPSATTVSVAPPTHKVTPSRIPSKSPTPKVATTPVPVGRDSNGFALGGPPQPSSPANYDHPSQSDCQRFLTELRAWSTYQNQHRPAGSTNYLPSSGEVQYLFVICGLRY